MDSLVLGPHLAVLSWGFVPGVLQASYGSGDGVFGMQSMYFILLHFLFGLSLAFFKYLFQRNVLKYQR